MDKVLIVDDNQFNRDLLEQELLDQSYVVYQAENGKKALEILQEKKPDIILLDIMMPGISGIEVLKKIRKEYSVSELPIIMVTAKGHSHDVVEALVIGANDYVVKPVDFPVLLARIQTHLTLKKLSQQKDEFIRVASHDLKNSLATIYGMAKVLDNMSHSGDTNSDIFQDFCRKIIFAANNMNEIIVDFLDFQAIEDGKLELSIDKINLNDIAKKFVESNKVLADSKNIKLVMECRDDLPAVDADARRIGQVMENLISNAVKYCPADSVVYIKTLANESMVLFEVIDNGPGLAIGDMKKVFDRYSRLGNQPIGVDRGSGLGLTICKMLIDLHDGEIGVQNNNDGGATFWFSLKI